MLWEARFFPVIWDMPWTSFGDIFYHWQCSTCEQSVTIVTLEWQWQNDARLCQPITRWKHCPSSRESEHISILQLISEWCKLFGLKQSRLSIKLICICIVRRRFRSRFRWSAQPLTLVCSSWRRFSLSVVPQHIFEILSHIYMFIAWEGLHKHVLGGL